MGNYPGTSLGHLAEEHEGDASHGDDYAAREKRRRDVGESGRVLVGERHHDDDYTDYRDQDPQKEKKTGALHGRG